MNTTPFSTGFSRVCNEYLLVAKPDAAMGAAVRAERLHFDQRYGEGLAVKARPHIAVGSFLATEEMERTLIAWMQRICSTNLSFTVLVNNYSGYPAHSIYLRVQNQQPLLQLAKQLQQIDSYVAGNTGHAVRWNQAPHIMVAQRLTEEVYFNALVEYAHKEMTGTFVVDGLQLLRRTAPDAVAEKVAVFGLRPEVAPVFQHQQLQLF
ncbi:MAG: hypothetical protein EAY75_07495 [Bacteroidetes bacterium]|nr:MAG: hypothetical protein EAY75_07495 [Bacteroidota bacterium]